MESETTLLKEKIALHSHITGLGDTAGDLEYSSDGLVSQLNARKALSIYKHLIQNAKHGVHLFLNGPSGSGKSALIEGLRKSLGTGYIFNHLNASELSSRNLSLAETLLQSARRSIGLKIKETVRVIEGEVVSIFPGKITLRTVDMESSFEIGANMKDQLKKEKVCVGDIIRIIKERGKIIKMGVGSARNDPQMLGDIQSLPCPEGDLFKVEEEVQYVSLHDIDAINNKTLGYLSLFDGSTTEICSSVRESVNDKVKKWILEGKAELIRGVLCIDDIHLLKDEAFTMFNKILDDVYAPFVVLTTHKSISNALDGIKDGQLYIPKCIRNRLLFVNLGENSKEDIKNILLLKLNIEKIVLESDCIEHLAELAMTNGIDYATKIGRLANLRRCKQNRDGIDIKDIERMRGLFLDQCLMTTIFK